MQLNSAFTPKSKLGKQVLFPTLNINLLVTRSCYGQMQQLSRILAIVMSFFQGKFTFKSVFGKRSIDRAKSRFNHFSYQLSFTPNRCSNPG